MKIMTYNILGEDDSRLNLVLEAIKQQSPDFLTIQEANYFPKNRNHYLKLFSKILELPFYEISKATEYDYHVASFSKFSFKKVTKLKSFRNACLETVIETKFGEISICNTHLTPYTEDDRLKEIKILIKHQKKYVNKIILGDLNSLSSHDNYDIKKAIVHDSQHRKFTKDGMLQFRVIETLESAGYLDTMFNAGKNHHNTVPTPVNKDKAHGTMRLDYIFVSSSLKKQIKKVQGLKNKLTDQASDHYPIVAVVE